MNAGNINVNDIQLMRLFQENTMTRLNCHNIGKIINFYPETQTADIQIQQIMLYKGELHTPSLLTNVPVFLYATQTAYITMPNPVGSSCILLFMDRNIDNYLATGEMYQPNTTRMHDMTDCIALLTFKTQVDTIQDYDNEAITLKNTIKDEEENLKSAQIKITDKLNLQNDTQNLATLIQSLLTACENIVTVADESGGGLNPSSKQAFTDLKTQFEELLK